MQSNNQPPLELVILIAIGTIVIAAIQFVMLVVGFLTVIGSVVAFCALPGDLKFGNTSICTQQEARAFFGRGLVAGGLAVGFWLFCCPFLDLAIEAQPFGDIFACGFCFGSTVLGIAEAIEAEEKAKAAANATEILPPIERPKAILPPPPAPRPVEEFHYAMWDDEERQG